MGRKAVITVALVALAALGLEIYQRATTFTHVRIARDVYVIFGPGWRGGNVGVLRTDAGTVVVDTLSFPFLGRGIARLARELTGQPVVMIINTHHHVDHTHGNPAFGREVPVIATGQARRHLLSFDAEFWAFHHHAGFPSETFESERRISLGGKTLRLVHPGRGHTDGDLVVLFEDQGVVHMGDLLFHRLYPNIDPKAGGSVRHWIETLDRVLALDFVHAVPGHGEITDRAGVAAFRAFLADVWALATEAARAGLNLDQTRARAATALAAYEDYGESYIPFVLDLDRDFIVQRAWEEAITAEAD